MDSNANSIEADFEISEISAPNSNEDSEDDIEEDKVNIITSKQWEQELKEWEEMLLEKELAQLEEER